jgi:hypothetical protein
MKRLFVMALHAPRTRIRILRQSLHRLPDLPQEQNHEC